MYSWYWNSSWKNYIRQYKVDGDVSVPERAFDALAFMNLPFARDHIVQHPLLRPRSHVQLVLGLSPGLGATAGPIAGGDPGAAVVRRPGTRLRPAHGARHAKPPARYLAQH